MCDSCEIMIINGIGCHEQGCPNAFRDEVRDCKWCGDEFHPEFKEQGCCSNDCEESFGF